MGTQLTEDETLRMVVAMHRLLRSLRRATSDGSRHPTQLIVLSLLVSGPQRIGELAARVPCSQPTATTVVAGLEAAGLVRREHDPSDGRATRVALTDTGATTLRTYAREEALVLGERLAALPADDQALVFAACEVFQRLAEPLL